MKHYQYSLVYSSLLAAFALPVYADDQVDTIGEYNAELETIIVSDTPFSQQIGTQKITEQQIQRLPSKNGGITDLLKSNPNVRFSDQGELSSNAGEIAPNEVSFHGEKYYNNNFVLDGMSNNDNINPSGNIDRQGVPIGSNPYDLPSGNSQSMWINANLLQSVEAFDSNISAKYGNFTGGVINAKLKDPAFDRQRSGRVYYRTTRSAWTTFYIDNRDENQFTRASRLDFHPVFKKQTYGLEASEKLSENFAILFNYERTQSDIDYYHSTMRYIDNPSAPVPNQQKRTNETYLLKGVYLADNGDMWRGTVIYSPHKSKVFKPNIKNGEFTSTGGGFQANLDWEHQLDWGKMTSYIGYKKTGDEIKHEEGTYHRYMATPEIDWMHSPLFYPDGTLASRGTYAAWGGYGTYFTEKEIYTLKQDFDATSFEWAGMEHKLSFGWSTEIAKAKYHRDNDNWMYFYQASPSVQCGNATECINNSQFAFSSNLYQARNVNVNDTNYALYIQDQIKWKRLEMTLGARVDHNKFLGNTSLAHRISASYDLFGDGSTQLFGGLNRYYGNSMLAFQLRKGIGSHIRYERALVNNQPNAWSMRSDFDAPTNYYMTKVKTPYSDEQVLGLSQQLWNTRWTFKWVGRHSRNQFSSDIRRIDGDTFRVLNNNGWSKNDTFTLAMAPISPYKFKYMELSWDAGLRISRTKTNNTYYDQSSTDDNAKAIYNNQLIDSITLPPADFNTPWSSFVDINLYFPTLRLNWDQRINYTRGRKFLEASQSSVACNGIYTETNYRAICGDYVGEATEYLDAETGSYLTVDWRFTYKQPTFKNQFLELTLDINNVFNRKALSRTKSTGSNARAQYKQGRNYWLGISYNW
ncbi:TonB-dependent receptor plug domain-containing protein [Conservatibacter flavescens]|uniref:TonB-dependent receptor n=1 Tax=Conservatibacter flavescens TaxID=28161 RepID=A0A2M8S2L8_9PAST|nr:TonB-dependent receptor plug domain-containing protein [Conservatibacter flavescens]PJG85348.1 TonB-dependent receptor [Conservatibacter flavescens]